MKIENQKDHKIQHQNEYKNTAYLKALYEWVNLTKCLIFKVTMTYWLQETKWKSYPAQYYQLQVFFALFFVSDWFKYIGLLYSRDLIFSKLSSVKLYIVNVQELDLCNILWVKNLFHLMYSCGNMRIIVINCNTES